MNDRIQIAMSVVRMSFSPSLLALAIALSASAAVAAPATTTLPDTPAGKVGGELIQHVNTDKPAQIEKWVPTILSSAMDQDDKTNFAKAVASAARDSGGVDLVDVRNQQGMLVLTVKGHRGGQLALFVLAADPAQPAKLGQADLVPMDDPALDAAWPKAAMSREEITHLIRTMLDRLVRTNDFSGCLTVSDGGETVFDECRGMAERGSGVPIDRQTKFHIGSMDKMFTAVAIAQLVEAGKLSWDSTLAQLVPEYPDREAAQKITVWQLLHHTAGLGDFFVPAFFQNREKFVNPVDYLDLIARQPKVSEPGKDWNYSNAGYMLLGRIIENVSHENYFDYIQRHVFAPAGMESSGFDSQEDITPKLAVGYFREGPFSTDLESELDDIAVQGQPGRRRLLRQCGPAAFCHGVARGHAREVCDPGENVRRRSAGRPRGLCGRFRRSPVARSPCSRTCRRRARDGCGSGDGLGDQGCRGRDQQ